MAFLTRLAIGGEEASGGGAFEQSFDRRSARIIRGQGLVLHDFDGAVEAARRLGELALAEPHLRKRRRRLPEHARTIGVGDQNGVVLKRAVFRNKLLRRGQPRRRQPALRGNDIAATVRIAEDAFDLRLRGLILASVDGPIERFDRR